MVKGYVKVRATRSKKEVIQKAIDEADRFMEDKHDQEVLISKHTMFKRAPWWIFWNKAQRVVNWGSVNNDCPLGVGTLGVRVESSFFGRSSEYDNLKKIISLCECGDEIYLDDTLAKVWKEVVGCSYMG